MAMTYQQALAYLYSLTNYEVKAASAYAPQFMFEFLSFSRYGCDSLLGIVTVGSEFFRSIYLVSE